MFVRALFLLLLALNIAAGLWLWLAPSAAVPVLPRTDPGVAALTLLGEQLASLGDDAAELAAAPEPLPDAVAAADAEAVGSGAPVTIAAAVAPVPTTCIEIGPIQTQAELRQAETALAAIGRPLSARESTERRFRGYWVYLPATASRAEALDTARALADAGVRDYYVVTAGDRENTISLGLFRDRDNAERRQAEMRSQGYRVELSERVEEQHVYWLGLAHPGGTRDEEWREVLPIATGDLQARPISCPT